MKLAIEGGTPVREELLQFHKPSVSYAEVNKIRSVLLSGWLTYGSKCKQLEDKIKSYTRFKHCIVLNSCTSGLILAVSLLKGESDTIQTSDNTFIATANAIELNGQKTELLDINPRTLNMIDPTKDSIIVNYGGNIKHIRRKTGFVIEDSAHSFVPKRRQFKSDITLFSFYSTKTMTTGTGGAICWDKNLDEEQVRSLCLHGLTTKALDRYKTGSLDYDCKQPGNNLLMDDIHAAIGLCQIQNIANFTERRLEIAKRYIKAFKHSNVSLPVKFIENKVFHLFPVLVKNKEFFMKALRAEGIATSSHFKPLHRFTYYKKKYNLTDEQFPMSSYVYDKEVSLPIYPSMTESDVDDVIKAVRKLGEPVC